MAYITGDVTAGLEGLRITRGDAAGMGGGIYVVSATVTVEACQVYDNAATHGSGIYVANSAGARMTNNSLHDNAASSGGRIYLSGSTNGLLENDSVHDNTAASGSGGGVHLRDDRLATLTNNVIVENQLDSCGCGAEVRLADKRSENNVQDNLADPTLSKD